MADAVQNGTHGEGGTRRDFMTLAGVAMGAVGAGAVGWTFIDYMNPSADVLALASIELDLSDIAEGSAITAFWRGQPVFVRHRSAEEIALAEATPLDDLPDPQADSERVVEPKWLIMVGVCT
ncbi:MAG: ubiquinol-cytochrome c reductase iron-sulfur subunit, partial [Pseudomonadota bacterium]